MKKIIVVGYPKSGCTWATRLVAELVGCLVAGFWQSDKKEIAVEGEHRVSDFFCYKSHHQLGELGLRPDDPDVWLIYVLRDPRDIAISAANYFQFDRFPRLAALFRSVRRGEKLYRHTLYPLLVSQNYRLDRMTEALLHGSAEVHNWCRVSWREHWRPRQAGVSIIRYEICWLRRRNNPRIQVIWGSNVRRRRLPRQSKTNRLSARRSAPAGGGPDRQNSCEWKKRPMARKTPDICGALHRRTGRNWRDGVTPPNEQAFRALLGGGFVRAIFESADLSRVPFPAVFQIVGRDAVVDAVDARVFKSCSINGITWSISPTRA